MSYLTSYDPLGCKPPADFEFFDQKQSPFPSHSLLRALVSQHDPKKINQNFTLKVTSQ